MYGRSHISKIHQAYAAYFSKPKTSGGVIKQITGRGGRSSSRRGQERVKGAETYTVQSVVQDQTKSSLKSHLHTPSPVPVATTKGRTSFASPSTWAKPTGSAFLHPVSMPYTPTMPTAFVRPQETLPLPVPASTVPESPSNHEDDNILTHSYAINSPEELETSDPGCPFEKYFNDCI